MQRRAVDPSIVAVRRRLFSHILIGIGCFAMISCLILCFQVLEECLGKSGDKTQLDDSSPAASQADNVPVSHVGLSSYYKGEVVEIGK